MYERRGPIGGIKTAGCVRRKRLEGWLQQTPVDQKGKGGKKVLFQRIGDGPSVSTKSLTCERNTLDLGPQRDKGEIS